MLHNILNWCYLSVTRLIQDMTCKEMCGLAVIFPEQFSTVELQFCYSYHGFRQKFGYFFFAKRVKVFAIIYQNNWANATLFPRASRLRNFFLAIACTADVILPEIARVSQMWSKLAGHEELSGGFEPITNGEIFWINNNER